jgi:hypothetical protein
MFEINCRDEAICLKGKCEVNENLSGLRGENAGLVKLPPAIATCIDAANIKVNPFFILFREYTLLYIPL